MMTEYERAIYFDLKEEYAGNKKVVINYNTLRAESQDLGTQGAIQFDINQQAQFFAATPTEVRLNLTDNFLCTRMGIYICKVPAAGNRNTSILRTYPNQRVFNNAGEATNLNAIYNGFLQIKENNDVRYQNIDTLQMLYVPELQEQLANVTALPAGYTAAGIDKDPFKGDESAMIELNPAYKFGGASKNSVLLQLNTNNNSFALAGAGGTTNFVVLIMRGFLIQNASLEKQQGQ